MFLRAPTHTISPRGSKCLAAIAIVVALVAVACGRDQQTSAIAQTSASQTSAAASDRTSPPDDVNLEKVPEESVEPSGGLASGGFGNLVGLCGPGDAQPVRGQTGIAGTTITIGTFSDTGFAGLPGLNQEFFDTAHAAVEWCNNHGGVRGYKLESALHDAAFSEYANRMLDACETDFFIVGGGGTLDDTGQPARFDCGLPEISAFSINTAASNADILLTTLPNPNDEFGVAEQVYAERRWPELIGRSAILVISTPATLSLRDRYLEYFDTNDWAMLYSGELAPLGEANYAPFIRAMRDAGVEIVNVVAIEPSVLAKLQQAAATQQFEPTAWIVSTNIYDQQYIELAGDVTQKTFVRSLNWPFELADENPATAEYLELLVGGKTSVLGVNAMSGWVLFLESLGSCIDSGTITRDCVYSEAAMQTEWTGGGLHGRIDVSHGSAPNCGIIMEATPDGFVVAPDQKLDDSGYNCDPANVAPLAGNYGEGATCPSGKPDPLPSECAA